MGTVVPGFRGGGVEGWRGGVGGHQKLYLVLQCHHQNFSALKNRLRQWYE